MLTKQNISFPNFLEDEFTYEWHMSRNERYAFIKLLEKTRPKVAIEIGCFKGGSLEILSKFSEKVYSIDIDPKVKENLHEKFDNVDIRIGPSSELIPKILKEIDKKGEVLEFVLIDGEHTVNGVKNDITHFLNYIPKRNVHIVFHDSFNPLCRKGIKKANYNSSPYVHYVELDFISGVFNPGKLYRQMWGGLALVLLKPEKRRGSIKINECQKKIFNTVYWKSIHPLRDRLIFLKPLVKKLIK
ncbi:class I SAM-dependent methyltransferase [Tenacibaculum agarivorans]|uniref:class I SAM-dependent methyltransferase n=1 Tax=Tenacibaculum agarivorans TaxID=1908389 RepID=UPI00094B8213|nr:class I SAM-dependent methyltransferase [Tenacibaculum agarivorans]